MSKIRFRLLDLFCGAGGCSVGYHDSGFEVVGVDIEPQPSYPFEFHQADAFRYLVDHGHEFDAIHASPKCQAHTISKHIHKSGGTRHPDQVGSIRLLLREFECPWIIENVMGAPLHRPVMLCGLMFGLRVLRHRLFESNVTLSAPPHPSHPPGNLTNSCHGYSTGANGFVTVAGHNFVREAGAKAMGVNWMKRREELAQAIPPLYTEFLGHQLLAYCVQRFASKRAAA